MLNSTKTWQEDFKNKFPDKIARVIDDFGDTTKSDLEQFISDLRKKDEQQLLLKLSLETQYYGREIEMKISKIIEEYYAKN